MTTMNTKNILELEHAFFNVVHNWTEKLGNLHVEYGIYGGKVKLEDGLPWLEVHGKFTKTTAKKFIQDLASALNIRMYFNRLESYAGSDNALFGVFDINPDLIEELPKTAAIPAYSDDEEAAEFMEDYGQQFLPK